MHRRAGERRWRRLVSLVVKLGALAFVSGLPPQYAINLQLLGGVWIIQTLPSVMFGLYTRWLHGCALLLGWLAGIVTGHRDGCLAAVQADLSAASRRLDDAVLRGIGGAGGEFDRGHRADPAIRREPGRRGADETKAAHYI